MEVFRIVKEKYADSLSGVGASVAGGRWNSKGVEIIYTAESRALAVLEVLVHLPKNLIPDDLIFITIEIPDDIVPKIVDVSDLPNQWFQFPPLRMTQQIGDDFVRSNENLLLKVPSAIVKNEFNYLINPYHTEFKKVNIITCEIFDLDQRLL